METTKKVVHPCFDASAKNMHARVHLPVAPKCNIQCNYCNRKYDCVSESRPGVTSAVVTPFQAVEYLKELSNYLENISVVGIAGPGDPMANHNLGWVLEMKDEPREAILYFLRSWAKRDLLAEPEQLRHQMQISHAR